MYILEKLWNCDVAAHILQIWLRHKNNNLLTFVYFFAHLCPDQVKTVVDNSFSLNMACHVCLCMWTFLTLSDLIIECWHLIPFFFIFCEFGFYRSQIMQLSSRGLLSSPQWIYMLWKTKIPVSTSARMTVGIWKRTYCIPYETALVDIAVRCKTFCVTRFKHSHLKGCIFPSWEYLIFYSCTFNVVNICCFSRFWNKGCNRSII